MTVLGLSSGRAAGLLFLQTFGTTPGCRAPIHALSLFLNRRHPGVELRVKPHMSSPGWWSVEAYDPTHNGPKYHWYVISAAGQVWSSHNGEACDITLRGVAS